MTSIDRLDAWLQQHAGDPREIELGLNRVAAVYAAMGRPAAAARVITVGGTNGKGSSVAMLEAIYEAAGYRTGAYTSPHLHAYRERVRLRGESVGEEEMRAAFEEVEAGRGTTALTYFEFGTLAALWLFARQPLDLVLLEVGLGGRLDAVNLIDADASLVTNIALDHQGWLGHDREAIGREKAGIFRRGKPAICGEDAPPQSLIAAAGELGADLRYAGRDFRARARDGVWDWTGRDSERKALPLPALRGAHQLQNAAAVLAVLEAMQQHLPVDQRSIRAGLLAAGLPGRLEVRADVTGTWVLDVAHNPAAARSLARALADQYTGGQTYALLGVLADKDVVGMAEALAERVDHWLLCGLPPDERGLSAGQLRTRLDGKIPARSGVSSYAGVEQGLNALAGRLKEADRILVLGSFLTVAAARDWLDRHSARPPSPV
jgi:dihydrofolate synthase/folylpolyglutamate synthase